MGLLYAKDGKIHCNEYVEIYIPKSYFESGFAQNVGASIETFGLCYIKSFPNGNDGPIKLFNVPTVINLIIYDFSNTSISIYGKEIDVLALKYPKDSYIMNQSVVKGREVAESFLATVLNGKLPLTLKYDDLIDFWWRNLEISGVSFKVPSKIYEMVLAAIYRDPSNLKRRYGQKYGSQTNPNGHDYATGNVRSVVRNLSTFSGMIFEDISSMITSGIDNSLNEIQEPESPLEKIIHY